MLMFFLCIFPFLQFLFLIFQLGNQCYMHNHTFCHIFFLFFFLMKEKVFSRKKTYIALQKRISSLSFYNFFINLFILFSLFSFFPIGLETKHILITLMTNIRISFYITMIHSVMTSKTKPICWNSHFSCIHFFISPSFFSKLSVKINM